MMTEYGYNECPECNGDVMKPIDDITMKCPRCGYMEKEKTKEMKNDNLFGSC